MRDSGQGPSTFPRYQRADGPVRSQRGRPGASHFLVPRKGDEGPATFWYQESVGGLFRPLGWRALKCLAGILAHNLARGQTSTLKMLWKFNSVYNPALQLADHRQPVHYEISLPPEHRDLIDPRSVYVHSPRGRHGRSIDDDTEQFVEQTRSNGNSSA